MSTQYNLNFNIISRQLEKNSENFPKLVVGDNNSNTIYIRTPAMFDGEALKNKKLILKYQTSWKKENGNFSIGQVELSNPIELIENNVEYLLYTWVLDQKQTLKPGVCKISIEFIENLDSDPFINETKYYFNLDEETNSISLEQEEPDNIVELRYWSLGSLSCELTIDDNGMIAGNDNNTNIVGEVDQTYDATSENAQSGIAVAEALEQFGNNLKTINGESLVGDGNIIVGGEGGNIVIENEYDPESENAQSGVAVAEALEGYVPKAESNGHTAQAYVVSSVGTQSVIEIEESGYFEAGVSYGQIPRRQNNGNILTNTPVKDLDCVNKKYVDDLIGDIEALLGGI